MLIILTLKGTILILASFFIFEKIVLLLTNMFQVLRDNAI